MMEPREIQDEEYEQILDRVAAIDVAKATGMVCTRVPDDSRPGRRLTKAWEIPATTNAIIELGEYLAGQEVQKVTLESTSVIRGSKAKNWTLRRSCRGRRVRGGEAKSAATRGGSQMSATVGYLRRRRSCR